jgi:hypothetical protein
MDIYDHIKKIHDIEKEMMLIEGYKLSQERNLALIEEFLGHIPTENDYLRKQGEKLLEDIRSGLTKVTDESSGGEGVVRCQANPDQSERHPGPLDAP